jgi:hypothetical protein
MSPKAFLSLDLRRLKMAKDRQEGAYARAAINDIADGLSMIERAIGTLELEESRKVFADFAQYIARAAQKRVTRQTYREQISERDSGTRMNLKDWQTYGE